MVEAVQALAKCPVRTGAHALAIVDIAIARGAEAVRIWVGAGNIAWLITNALAVFCDRTLCTLSALAGSVLKITAFVIAGAFGDASIVLVAGAGIPGCPFRARLKAFAGN